MVFMRKTPTCSPVHEWSRRLTVVVWPSIVVKTQDATELSDRMTPAHAFEYLYELQYAGNNFSQSVGSIHPIP